MAKQIKYLDLDGLKALYGVVDSKITERINSLDMTDSAVDGEFVYSVSEEDGIIKVLRKAVASDKVTATAVEAVESGVDATVAIEGTNVKAQIESLGKSLKAEESARKTVINALDLTEVGGTGQFVQSVSQSDGQVTAVAAALNAAAVAATAIGGSSSTVAVAGDTVAEQIQSLGRTLKTVEGNAAKYKVVKLSAEEVTALGDANVKEAYKVVSYVGADAQGTAYTQVGEVIKIYKDGNLTGAELGKGADAQKLILKYTLADGSETSVKVDFAAIAFNAEFKNGLQVAENGEISVQVDTASEGFLTVGEGGIKLAGVKKAIDDAVAAKNVAAEGDAYINARATGNKVTVSADVQDLTVTTTPDADSTIAGVAQSLVDGAEVATKVAAFTNARISEEIAKLDATVGETTVAGGKHVAVQVVEADGKITAVNVNESDIASADALTTEINRAKAAEDKIEASVGLTADGSFTAPAGNYINGAATVMDAVEKLDVQAKANADKIAGMSVDEVNQTVTIDSKGLQFIALTSDEIRSAWTDRIAPDATIPDRK